MKKQKGVALVLALMLSAMFILLATSIQKEAQSQVYQAQIFQHKVEAFLNVKSSRSMVLFSLLTEHPKSLEESKSWNFYGKEITLTDNATTRVQDLNGLLNLYGIAQRSVLGSILAQCNIEQSRSSYIANVVLNIHNNQSTLPIDRHQRLIHLLNQENELNNSSIQCVNANISRFSGGYFNPFTAHDEYLTAKLGKNAASDIISARESGFINSEVFSRFSSDDPDSYQKAVVGPYYRVYISSNVEGAVWNETFEVKLEPSSIARPLHNLSYSPKI